MKARCRQKEFLCLPRCEMVTDGKLGPLLKTGGCVEQARRNISSHPGNAATGVILTAMKSSLAAALVLLGAVLATARQRVLVRDPGRPEGGIHQPLRRGRGRPEV